jgi:hypothetical protein
MRNEYELKHGRPNPYASRLGKKGRSELVQWWVEATRNVRMLPDDVAREFPDTESTVQALRLVVKLRAVKPKGAAKKGTAFSLTRCTRDGDEEIPAAVRNATARVGNAPAS